MLYVLSYVAGDNLITHNNQEIVKVGFTDDFNHRLSQYRDCYHLPSIGYIKAEHPIAVFANINGTRDQELLIHQCLSNHRAFNSKVCEWYNFTNEFRNEIEYLFRTKLDWSLNSLSVPSRGKKVSNLVTKFKDFLISELVAGESITRKEVENILLLTPEERETTGQSFKAFNLKKSKVGRDLISAGISFKGKKGPGGNVTFTKEN